MLVASAVVVWEWRNQQGRWRPYGPAVSHHIEAVIRADPRGGSIVLGQVDNRLASYIIDLQSMHQFRLDTGRIRPVRRSFFSPGSAPAQGWLWEWEGPGGAWTAYGTEACIALQAAREQLEPRLDMAPLGLGYEVDLVAMTQLNRRTGRRRRVRRRSDMAYPLVAGALPLTEGSGGGGGPTGAFLGVGASGAATIGGRGKKAAAANGGKTKKTTTEDEAANAEEERRRKTKKTSTEDEEPCGCQQCALVHTVKSSSSRATGAGSGTLASRRPSQSSTLGRRGSTATGGRRTLPHGNAIPRNTASSRRNAALFARSLAALASDVAAMAVTETPPPAGGSTPPPPVPTGTLVTPATAVTSPPSPVPCPSATVMAPERARIGSAPLPRRASLIGLSRPALQRIAVEQSRALIASGVPTVPVKNLNESSPVHPALAGMTGILMSAAGLPVCLTRPPRPPRPPAGSKQHVTPVPGFTHCSRKSKKHTRRGRSPEEVVKKFLEKVKNPSEEDCTICMEALGGPSGYCGTGIGQQGAPVGRLAQCGHQYHQHCLVAMYTSTDMDGSLRCPACQTVYGVKMGTQPPGTMEFHVIPHALPAHPDAKTIRIAFHIPPGIQGPEHPNPGKPFTARGFPRHCYLPDTPKGRTVLRLLVEAWERRLVFSLGPSGSAGEADTVLWSPLRPDPAHLDRTLRQLHAHGISAPSWPEE